MLLSRDAILRHLEKGNIVIDPFDKRKLKTTSYDVTLGSFYWKEKHPDGAATLHNVYDEDSTRRVWAGPYEAESAKEVAIRTSTSLKNIKPEERVILLRPGETILGHTEEFVGGRNCVVAKMYARSSLGRNFVEVCKDAGWGDIGYFNRWTMEITNNSQYFTIPLVAGRRISQIVFYEVQPLTNSPDYVGDKGKYQVSDSLEELRRSWNPGMMTPQMHKDWEIFQA